MAITLVQTKGVASTSNTNPQDITWTSNTTSGNFIVLGIWHSHILTLSTPTDSQSNTYTQIFNQAGGSGTPYDLALYYAKNIVGGATPTIHINVNNTGYDLNAIAREYSGIDITAPLDKSASVGGGSSTALNSGATAATTSANELIIGVGGNDDSNDTFTAGSGFGNLTTQATTDLSMAMEDQIVSATGAQTGTMISTGSGFWAMGVATFIGAAPTGSKILKPNALRPHAFSPGLAR